MITDLPWVSHPAKELNPKLITKEKRVFLGAKPDALVFEE